MTPALPAEEIVAVKRAALRLRRAALLPDWKNQSITKTTGLPQFIDNLTAGSLTTKPSTIREILFLFLLLLCAANLSGPFSEGRARPNNPILDDDDVLAFLSAHFNGISFTTTLISSESLRRTTFFICSSIWHVQAAEMSSSTESSIGFLQRSIKIFINDLYDIMGPRFSHTMLTLMTCLHRFPCIDHSQSQWANSEPGFQTTLIKLPSFWLTTFAKRRSLSSNETL
ncbi:cytochrome b6 [Striga asiatica]|uniref:Cytochrome b6 n=1 Tax=Striga asiatica TaxID=4170 RepID=A0A5A7QGE3_STRAF|nr:cytochrome b6 [Striga asiatica]